MIFLRANRAFFLILTLAIALRMICLDKGISGDERFTLQTAQAKPAQILQLVSTRESHPPLTFYLLNLWMRLSSSEVWIRMYFVIFGIGVSVLIYLIGLEALDKRFALFAFACSAVSPLLIWSAQYIRSYADSGFWIMAATLFFLKALNNRNKIFWLAYSLACCLAVYTFYFSWFFIAAQFLYVAWEAQRRRLYFSRMILSQGLVLLLFSPLVYLFWKQMSAVATAGKEIWTYKGLQVFGFRVGALIRNIMTLVGMDPDFLGLSLQEVFANKILLLQAISILGVFALILGAGFASLARILKGKGIDAWFFLFLSLGPIIAANIAGRFVNLALNAKYLCACHGIFIFFFAAILYRFLLEKKRTIAYVSLSCFVLLYLARAPVVYAAEFDLKGAERFINSRFKNSDCIVVFNRDFADFGEKAVIELRPLLARDEKSGDYLPLTPVASVKLNGELGRFQAVYLYLTAGNAKLFGANQQIRSWFSGAGFKLKSARELKNIEILVYERE